jgi:hypothetical protein
MFRKILKNKKFFLTLSLIFIFCLFSPYFLFTQAETKPETIKAGLSEYVIYFFNFAILSTGLILFVALIYGGILYLTSVGQVAKLKAAKEQIVSAFLGIIILLSSYIILTTINPQLVMFHFPPLPEIADKRFICAKDEDCPPNFICQEGVCISKKRELSLIFYEIPLGQIIRSGVWEDKRIEGTKNLLDEIENFLKEEIKVGRSFERISDLNRYLFSLTAECQCGYLQGERGAILCTQPWDWALPIGCTGDPCLEETRKKMEKILKINEEKMKKFLDLQKKAKKERLFLEAEMNKRSEAQKAMIDCFERAGRLYSFTEYLSLSQFYKDIGKITEVVRPFPEYPVDALTFYCSVGGTAFDDPRTPPQFQIPLEEIKLLELEAPEIRPFHCPAEFPIGEVLTNLKNLEFSSMIQKERFEALIGEMVSELQKMADLTSQCNSENCKISCGCLPNPCYGCCSPVPCGPCVYFCKSRCLQAIGQCNGIPCPWKEIGETTEKIKKLEDEIFSAIKAKRETFPQINYNLESQENPINLNELKKAVNLCSSPITTLEEAPILSLLNCSLALGNYGPDGRIIGACRPWNFFCCSHNPKAAAHFPRPVKDPRPLPLPPKDYPVPPPSVGATCPPNWRCTGITGPHYADAAEPLRQLLACMRNRLDAFQKEKELEKPLGRITSITDSHLYYPYETCDWHTGGPGCQHTHLSERSRISCHYGGLRCRGQSYAVDIGVNRYDFERKYAHLIIKAATECNPGVYVEYKTASHYDHIHISVGAQHGCGCDALGVTKLADKVIRR